MTEGFSNFVRREIGRALGDVQHSQDALVTSYDPASHSIKATLQPQGIETGWVDGSNQMIGDGFGIAVGYAIGDQVKLGFRGGDLNSPYVMGRVPSDKDRPPVAQSGEVVIRVKNGTQIKIDQAGAMTITTNGQPMSIASGGGAMSFDAGSGAVAITSATLSHNGKNIGDSHAHSGVTPGTSNTGPPA